MATKGGDGTILYDHNEIVELYNLGYSTGQIASKLNCDTSTIRKVLKSKGIKSRGLSHIVDQFDLAGNYIQTFDSAIEAGQWVVERGLSKSKHHDITRCCKGIKKEHSDISGSTRLFNNKVLQGALLKRLNMVYFINLEILGL